MPLTIINSLASWFLKKRINQIEEFISNPKEVQERVCAKLLEVAKDTEVGKKYDFQNIKNYRDFSQKIPLSIYEDIEPMIERARRGEVNIFWNKPIKWFAKSSGTTNAKSKFIPISDSSLNDCHYKAGKDMLCLYLNNNEDSKLFKGKSLRLGGSKELYQENGTVFGDLSAILIDNLPFWADFSSTPSNKVSLMSEWNAKMKAIIEEATKEDVTSLVGVPSWMLVLLNKTMESEKKYNILDIWPNLEVFFHGGVSFVPYVDQYKKIIPSDKFRYYETYNASEGFFAIQDRNQADDMLLMLDYGIFYEFIQMDTFGSGNEKIVPVWEVEKDKNYAMVITTNGGLWRYVIGDTVRFTSLAPYRIKITGRTKHFINVFGEELIIENTETALKRTCHMWGGAVREYTVAPIFMQDRETGGHEWMIEFSQMPDDMDEFTRCLDQELKKLNSDYEAKRYNDMTLKMPKINIAKDGLFMDWLREKDKLGGQNKIPRLSNSREFLDTLKKMNQ